MIMMFEGFQTYSVAASDYFIDEPEKDNRECGENEDACCFGVDYLVVIDGATGLNSIHLTNEPTDTGWMSKRLAMLIGEKFSMDVKKTTKALLTECAMTICAELDEFGYESKKNSYPSACISIVRAYGDKIQCYVLGDVPILLHCADGSFMILTDDAVPKRDAKIIEWIIKKSKEEGITVREATKRAKDMLLKNRLEMNMPNGYWIFEPTGAGIEHGIIKEFDRNDITEIALMSDGFYEIYELFGIEPLDVRLFDELRMGKAPVLSRLLRSIQAGDMGCDHYPRLKPADDSTVLYAQVTRAE
ncbi:MAG: protein phosphatase 2C domain-containing protein [Lachnospiraceae bacterium]|nr:protein phosphatase 2C domain-containing protein [Lachnospiraceae bacterium]